MNREKLNKKLKEQTKLYEVCLGELYSEKLQNDSYQANLDEIKDLLENNVNPNLIFKVITNFEERQFLDRLIHNATLFGQKPKGLR